MGFWDDNRAPSSGTGSRLRFVDYGDRVKGRVTEMATFDGTNGKVPLIKLADVSARQAGVDSKLETGEFIGGATVLWAQLEDQRVDVGHIVDVEYTGEKRAQSGFMVKQFAVKSQAPISPVIHAIGDQPRPPDAAAPPSDVFA